MSRPQMGESEQGLAAGAQAPPAGADRTAVPPQLLCEETKGRAGHVQPGRVDKHVKPLAETVLLENPSTRSFTTLSAQPSHSRSRLEKAPCSIRTVLMTDRGTDSKGSRHCQAPELWSALHTREMRGA